VLRTHIDSPTYSASYYDPRGKTDLWFPLPEVPYLKLAAVHNEGGRLTLFALNRHLSEELPLEVEAKGFSGLSVERATSLHHADLAAVNTRSEPERVRPAALPGARVDGERIRVTLPPGSWNVLRLKP
jgi:alpha-N-arabinofuranosidase